VIGDVVGVIEQMVGVNLFLGIVEVIVVLGGENGHVVGILKIVVPILFCSLPLCRPFS
jgi:hypothetical protein